MLTTVNKQAEAYVCQKPYKLIDSIITGIEDSNTSLVAPRALAHRLRHHSTYKIQNGHQGPKNA